MQTICGAVPPAVGAPSQIPLVEGRLEVDGSLGEPFWREALSAVCETSASPGWRTVGSG
jgi:hypothetical protein